MKPSKSTTESHQFSVSSKLHEATNPNPTSTTTSAFLPTSLFYEPTSVLDPHLTSSPATAGHNHLLPPSSAVPTTTPPSSDDWDPVAWLFSEKDDFTPLLKPPQSHFQFPEDPYFPDPFDLPDLDHLPSFPSSDPPLPTFDRLHLDLLIRAAQSIESNDLQSAHVILARLNQYLPSAASSGSPLQRAAFHFKDALLSLLPIPDRPSAEPPLSALEIVRRISSQKALSDLSPVPQFTSFTANQTLVEALDGAPSLHLIDFEIGLGGQWSSFAQEIAARSRASRTPPPPIRITAVVPEESVETALAAENLRDFARGLGIRLSLDFIRVGGLGTLALGGVRQAGGDAVGVVLTPTIFRLLGGSPESSTALLRFVRCVSPRIVVFVDTECFSAHQPSFRRSFVGGLEFYSAVLESLDAAAAATESGDEPVRRIERSVIRPRVFASVVGWAARTVPWREMFAGAGMVAVPFSEFTKSQAEWLLRRAPIDEFNVARREGSMVLSWRGRELAATSAWRC